MSENELGFYSLSNVSDLTSYSFERMVKKIRNGELEKQKRQEREPGYLEMILEALYVEHGDDVLDWLYRHARIKTEDARKLMEKYGIDLTNGVDSVK